MVDLTIALLQPVSPGSDEDVNLEKGLAFCGRARDAGADIALFPEMWSIGYTFSADEAGRAELDRRSLDLDAPFVRRHAELAAELDMAIGVTFPQRWQAGRGTHSRCSTARASSRCCTRRCTRATGTTRPRSRPAMDSPSASSIPRPDLCRSVP